MTPEGLARTHTAAFGGKGWPDADFARYLDDPTVIICGDETCFTVLRVTAPEAEILTLATHPDAQGKGLASQMMVDSFNQLKTAGV